MKLWNLSKKVALCLVTCGMILTTAIHAEAQVTYTITGVANNFGTVVSGPVGEDEPYTAVFEVDDSVLDSDDAVNRGEYTGAIISSRIEFENGFVSTVDFSGGDVVVLEDSSGHGLFLRAPGGVNTPGSGIILVYSLDPFGEDIDALISSPQEVSGLPGTLWSISEIDGTRISAFSSPDQVQSLSVTAPVLLGDVNLSGGVDFLDIAPFIGVLQTNGYQIEADMNQDRIVNFLDIGPFITFLASL